MNAYEINRTLGITYTKEYTEFRVWSQYAKKIDLLIYDSYESVRPMKHYMTRNDQSVFVAKVLGDLEGKFYTYLIDGKSEVTDPYSIASSINSIKSAIVDLAKTDPPGFRAHRAPKTPKEQALIYEVHVKDFTADLSSSVQHRGKFLGFVDERGEIRDLITGIRHLVELGITHVHLQPVFDFLSVREEPSMFFDADNYNWGYDPELYNVVEGSYSTDPYDPSNRITEFKFMVMKLHEAGISVILDVVYNHTYRTKDSNFNALNPGYYYRGEKHHFTNGSGCGNEFASEKEMAQAFILRSLLYWQEEYRVDGFRFDLMALMDLDTTKKLVKELRAKDPNIILYGEPWAADYSPLDKTKMTVYGSQRDENFALFNAFYRDSLKGDNDGNIQGFIQGNYSSKTQLESGIVGSIAYDELRSGFCSNTTETINYFNSHDNLIMADKLKLYFGENEIIKRLTKLAFSILLTSLGIPIFVAGNEFMRTKKLVSDSYNKDLSINAISWDYKHLHHEVFLYVKDIITLRKRYPHFKLTDPAEIRESVRFVSDVPEDTILYFIKHPESTLMIVHRAYRITRNELEISTDQITHWFNDAYGLNQMALQFHEVFDRFGECSREDVEFVVVQSSSTTIVEIKHD